MKLKIIYVINYYLSKTKANTCKNVNDKIDDYTGYILPNIMFELNKCKLNTLASIIIITNNNKIQALDKIRTVTKITNKLIDIIQTHSKNRNICFDINTGERSLDLVYKSIDNCKDEINKAQFNDAYKLY